MNVQIKEFLRNKFYDIDMSLNDNEKILDNKTDRDSNLIKFTKKSNSNSNFEMFYKMKNINENNQKLNSYYKKEKEHSRIEDLKKDVYINFLLYQHKRNKKIKLMKHFDNKNNFEYNNSPKVFSKTLSNNLFDNSNNIIKSYLKTAPLTAKKVKNNNKKIIQKTPSLLTLKNPKSLANNLLKSMNNDTIYKIKFSNHTNVSNINIKKLCKSTNNNKDLILIKKTKTKIESFFNNMNLSSSKPHLMKPLELSKPKIKKNNKFKTNKTKNIKLKYNGFYESKLVSPKCKNEQKQIKSNKKNVLYSNFIAHKSKSICDSSYFSNKNTKFSMYSPTSAKSQNFLENKYNY